MMSESERAGDDSGGWSILDEVERLTGVTFAEVMGRLPEKAVSAWVSGSLVEGLAHASSDLDIYVLVDDLDSCGSTIRKDDGFAVNVEFINQHRVDFEYWTGGRIAALAKKLADVPLFEESENVLDYFPEPELDFMHRVHIGVPLLGRSAWEALCEAFDHRRLRQYLIENKRLYVDDTFDDAVGLLRAGHLTSAVLRARYALETSLDMLIYSHGVTNSKEKQRTRLFLALLQKRPELAPVYKKFWSMTTCIPQSDEGMLAYVEDALRFSEEIIGDVQRRML